MSFKPLQINYAENGHDASIYGGKAASLYRLIETEEFAVPTAFVIPCDQCLIRPEIDLQLIRSLCGSNNRYAVRSGAPVSMPGLLQTKLNVSFYDLEAAIKEVWDSWNTEHAVAYRKAKGIPDNIGTAVIIQSMINSQYSGVAFTANTETPECTDFDPLIEYVEGLGDALVGGEVTPKKLRSNSLASWAKVLRDGLKLIHSYWGPSDVEWCVDEYGSLWFVQQRPLKFSKSLAHTVDESGKTVVFAGKAIGSPKQITAYMSMASTYKLKPGNAVYVGAFRPEYYMKMVEASAILCGVGGATCHASILARELDKPAISGMGEHTALDLVDKPLLIDGATAKVYKFDREVAVTKPTKLVRVLDETRCPNGSLQLYTSSYNVNYMLVRFYQAIKDWQEGKISEERKVFVAREIADVLCLYFYKACLGELRHVKGKASDFTKFWGATALMRRVESLIGQEISGGDRDEFVNSVTMPTTLKEAITTMRAVEAAFSKLPWRGGYGGKKWGKIAQVLLKYLAGDYSPIMFVDNCFNLKHNGGCAFGKFSWITCNNGIIKYQLNHKQEGDLTQATKVYADYCGGHHNSAIAHYVQKESIFYEGTKNVKEVGGTNDKQAKGTHAVAA